VFANGNLKHQKDMGGNMPAPAHCTVQSMGLHPSERGSYARGKRGNSGGGGLGGQLTYTGVVVGIAVQSAKQNATSHLRYQDEGA